MALPGISAGPYETPAGARQERHFSAGTDGGSNAAGPAWGGGAYLGTFLLLSLAEAPDGMALIARGVFDRPTVRHLLSQFLDLVSDALAAPDRRVSDLVATVPAAPGGAERLDLRGFRVDRARIEAALASCPGVVDLAVAVRTDAAGEPRLVAYVVTGPGPPPTLAGLRAAQWAALPGTPWPSALVVVNALARRPDGGVDVNALRHPPTGGPPAGAPDPVAAALLTAWADGRGGPVGLRDSYWQDFSFLPAVAAARAAGLPITNEQVARNRTVEALAADVGAATVAPVS